MGFGRPLGPAVKQFTTAKDDAEVVRLALIHLFLTCPGERVMMAAYGVGLPMMVQDQMEPGFTQEIVERANRNIANYGGYADIKKINVALDQSSQIADVIVYYTIPIQNPTGDVVETMTLNLPTLLQSGAR